METKAQKQFVAAVNFLMKNWEKKPIYQKELAKNIDMDPAYLNKILKGKVPGSQVKKEAIAQFFKLDYLKILTLGQYILEGNDGKQWLSNHITNNFLQSCNTDKHNLCITIPKNYFSYLTSIEEIDNFIEMLIDSVGKSKNCFSIFQWIIQQDNPDDYWTLLKFLLSREEPEFKQWLLKEKKKTK